jgi:hypothetical protein
MGSPGDALREAVQGASPQLRGISETRSAARPASGGWSPREILGHLIDSAANNHRRFVLAQIQDELVFPGYEQEAWVRLQQYQGEPWAALVNLWEAYNLHLAHVMTAAPEGARTRPREKHGLDAIAFRAVPSDQPATLEWLMEDYVDHLQHHLGQIRNAVADDPGGVR